MANRNPYCPQHCVCHHHVVPLEVNSARTADYFSIRESERKNAEYRTRTAARMTKKHTMQAHLSQAQALEGDAKTDLRRLEFNRERASYTRSQRNQQDQQDASSLATARRLHQECQVAVSQLQRDLAALARQQVDDDRDIHRRSH
jgi:hypothetical protein